MLRLLAFFCGFAMLFLLEKGSKAGRHFCEIFLWEVVGAVGDVLSRFQMS